ncbi:MAG: PHP domain-containing protein [Candidatus Altiarchaeota archaeon]|nr:PHP domain-containing protein [Candidatus Altiarchaeota archaeon]
MKIDLHVHTNASLDGVSTAWEMIAAAKRAGLQGIAITDHNVLGWKNISPRNFVIIPGVELSLPEGHLLVLGIDKMPPADSLDSVMQWAKSNHAITIPAHPFDKLRHGMGELAFDKKFTAVEAINGMSLKKYSERALRTAMRKGIKTVSNSDAHQISEIGTQYNVIQGETVEQILESLRKGDFESVLRFNPVHKQATRIVSRKLRSKIKRN